MKGLLLKDWLMLFKQYRYMLLLILVYLIIGAVNANVFFASFAGLFVAMLPITALGLDERSRWDSFAVMLPCSKKDVVYSKYLFGVIGVAVTALLYMAFRTLFYAVKGNGVPFAEIVRIALGMVSVSLIFLSINLPIMFKKGVEKGRMWFLVTMVLMMAAGSALINLIRENEKLRQAADAVLVNSGRLTAFMGIWAELIAAVIITTVIMTVSVKISEQIYQKREV